jgi:hypothetical protein
MFAVQLFFLQKNLSECFCDEGVRGGAVVEVLRYKPEGGGIDS